MPYLTKDRRAELHTELAFAHRAWYPENAGDLNYIVSRFIDQYLATTGMSYAGINEMIGALECCKLELYRKIAAPYEDEKERVNGTAYENCSTET